MGKSRKGADAGSEATAVRSASPTGNGDAARQTVLQRCHRKLAAGFPHAMHVADLSAEDLAPSQPEYIIHVANFLSPEECAAMIAASEEVGLNTPSLKDLRPKKGEALLNRESFAFEDPTFGLALWARMQRFLPEEVSGRVPVGLTPRLRYYKYLKSHRFGKHVDQSVRIPKDSDAAHDYAVQVLR